jgi:hypothetical protein
MASFLNINTSIYTCTLGIHNIQTLFSVDTYKVCTLMHVKSVDSVHVLYFSIYTQLL